MHEQQHQSGFGMVEVVIAILVLALIGVGGWYVWVANQKSSNSVTGSGTTATSKAYSTFSTTQAPFTFKYSSDWSYSTDKPLQSYALIGTQYSITLTAPGTTTAEMSIGGSEVTQGARIIIWATKTELTDIHNRFTGVYSNATSKTNTTTAGVAAVEYEFSYESQPGIFTDFVKDGWLYSVGLFVPGTARVSDNFSDYKALLASFKFI